MPRGWNRSGHTTVDEVASPIAPSFQEPTFPVDVTPVAEATTYQEDADVARKTTYDEPQVEAVVEETPAVEPTDTPSDPEAAKAVSETESTDGRKGKRGPRAPIQVGNVIVRKSERTDFSTRSTPTKNNPVFQAFENAAYDEPTDVLVENDEKKIQGAITILRRAGAMLERGVHIAPKPYPTETIDGVDYAVVTFKKDEQRRTPGKSDDATGSTEAEADAA